MNSESQLKLELRATPDSNLLFEFFNVLVTEDGTAALQAFIINGVAIDDEFLNDRGGPLAELHSALGVDLAADGEDG